MLVITCMHTQWLLFQPLYVVEHIYNNDIKHDKIYVIVTIHTNSQHCWWAHTVALAVTWWALKQAVRNQPFFWEHVISHYKQKHNERAGWIQLWPDLSSRMRARKPQQKHMLETVCIYQQILQHRKRFFCALSCQPGLHAIFSEIFVSVCR